MRFFRQTNNQDLQQLTKTYGWFRRYSVLQNLSIKCNIVNILGNEDWGKFTLNSSTKVKSIDEIAWKMTCLTQQRETDAWMR